MTPSPLPARCASAQVNLRVVLFASSAAALSATRSHHRSADAERHRKSGIPKSGRERPRDARTQRRS
jgi:hypothetical protein